VRWAELVALGVLVLVYVVDRVIATRRWHAVLDALARVADLLELDQMNKPDPPAPIRPRPPAPPRG
jgi:hypothetical protein